MQNNDYEIPIVYLNEDEDWVQPELEGLEEKHPPEAFRDKANGEQLCPSLSIQYQQQMPGPKKI